MYCKLSWPVKLSVGVSGRPAICHHQHGGGVFPRLDVPLMKEESGPCVAVDEVGKQVE